MACGEGAQEGSAEGILFVAAVDGEAAGLPREAHVLRTGIGTLPAAIALTEYLAQARERGTMPLRVVNVGTAGALRDGMAGVYEVDRVTKHDFQLQVLTDIRRYLLPEVIEVETSGSLPPAPLATGDTFVSDSATRARLAREWALCDMEGYAIAAVCRHFSQPVTLLKQVSDPANEESVGAWDGALPRAATELAQACRRLGFSA